MVASNKIVTSSSPGSQLLPFRGCDALSHPLGTPSFMLCRGRGFKSQDPRNIFHIKFIMRKLSQTIYVSSIQPVSFNWKLHLISFLYYPTFKRNLFHFFTYSTGLWSCTQFLSWLSFHYPFLNPILSAILCDLWKSIELLSTPYLQIPSLIAWRRCLEKWTAYCSRSWEGGLAGGLLRWNRPPPSWYQGRGGEKTYQNLLAQPSSR